MKKLKYLPHFHKTLSLPARLKNVRKQFDKIPQNKVEGSVKLPEISLSDVLLSGLSIFNFKFPSLLQYDKQRNEPKIKANLTQLFGIKQTICDTQMRVRLDDVYPHLLRPASTGIHKSLQNNRVLDRFHYLDKHLLFSVDGTTYFQSDKVSCPCCNIKKKKNGTIEYSHQALVCSIVHLDKKQVFPFFHEDIHINHSNQNTRVNFIEHWEVPNKGPYKGQRKTFTYITNHLVEFSTVVELSKAGRTRSKIENETFNVTPVFNG